VLGSVKCDTPSTPFKKLWANSITEDLCREILYEMIKMLLSVEAHVRRRIHFHFSGFGVFRGLNQDTIAFFVGVGGGDMLKGICSQDNFRGKAEFLNSLQAIPSHRPSKYCKCG
jgi:hypothetical protein